MPTSKTPVLQPRADADVFEVIGGAISVRLRHEQTGGECALIENVIPGGYQALPMHTHADFDEAFYLLEGALSFHVGDDAITATPGTLVYAPGVVPHRFANYGEQPARMLIFVTPAGHERFFEELATAALASPDGWPEPAEIGALMRAGGITVMA